MPITERHFLLLLFFGGFLPLLLLPVDAHPEIYSLVWPPGYGRQWTGLGFYRGYAPLREPHRREVFLPFKRQSVRPSWSLLYWLPGNYTLPPPENPSRRQALPRDDPRFDGDRDNPEAVARGEPLPPELVRRIHERHGHRHWLLPTVVRMRGTTPEEDERDLVAAYQNIWNVVLPITPMHYPVRYFARGAQFHRQLAARLEEGLAREGAGITPSDDRPYRRADIEAALAALLGGRHQHFALLCVDMNAAEEAMTPSRAVPWARRLIRKDAHPRLANMLYSVSICVSPSWQPASSEGPEGPGPPPPPLEEDIPYVACPAKWPGRANVLVGCRAEQLWLYRTLDDGIDVPFADAVQVGNR